MLPRRGTRSVRTRRIRLWSGREERIRVASRREGREGREGRNA
ncbi:hypothetical protein [uncultured Nostoc sp.]